LSSYVTYNTTWQYTCHHSSHTILHVNIPVIIRHIQYYMSIYLSSFVTYYTTWQYTCHHSSQTILHVNIPVIIRHIQYYMSIYLSSFVTNNTTCQYTWLCCLSHQMSYGSWYDVIVLHSCFPVCNREMNFVGIGTVVLSLGSTSHLKHNEIN